ncbi:hypothetical protein L2E82_04669 [Cichorium intybus]|uniref:Uncharacterized protein n=1 Tax=Cichorium intybus TaxID=13427 RepID=A0ACB9H6P1_CICIN|nr:hypothetical protein L2E82_04669 [Cichorium intybus]
MALLFEFYTNDSNYKVPFTIQTLELVFLASHHTSDTAAITTTIFLLLLPLSVSLKSPSPAADSVLRSTNHLPPP